MADWFQLQRQIVELAEAGRPEAALELAREMAGRFPERSNFNWHPEACLLARLGRHDEALTRLEAAAAAGDLWRVRYLEDPDYEPIRSNPRFQALVEHAQQRGAGLRPELLTAEPARARAPLLLVLHGASAAAAPELERWRPAAALGFLVAALQSSQPAGHDTFCWDDLDRARADVAWALGRLPPRGRTVLAGFSQGAALALFLALEGSLVRARGVILVCPSIGRLELPGAALRLRVAALLGDADPLAAPAHPKLAELRDRGHHVGVEVVPGLSHAYPGDFAARLPGLLASVTRTD